MIHTCGFAASEGIQLKGSTKTHLRAEGLSFNGKANKQNISEWKVSVHRSTHKLNQHILGRRLWLSFYQKGQRNVYLYSLYI